VSTRVRVCEPPVLCGAAANSLGDKIKVIRGKVEEVVLPEKVDVIVSEPMGFMLVHERMLESYIAARELFLKPGGLMMPSTGVIFFAPFTDRALYAEQVRSAFTHHASRAT
jgi:histone-arginine methyltransferase CARM1